MNEGKINNQIFEALRKNEFFHYFSTEFILQMSFLDQPMI